MVPVAGIELQYIPEIVDVSDFLYSDECHDGHPVTRFRHAAERCGPYVYVYGGRSGHRALRDFWRLKLGTNQWQLVKPPENSTVYYQPGILEDHFMVTQDDALVLVGNGTDSVNRAEIQMWTLGNGCLSWSRLLPKSPNPHGRRCASGTMANGKLYIFGGIVDLYAQPTSELLEFDFDSLKWQSVPTGSTSVSPLYEHTTVFHTGKLYVFGGVKDQKAQNTVWTFDLVRNIWAKVTAPSKHRHPDARHGHAAVALPHCMMIHGGRNDQQRILGDLWSFGFGAEIWTKIDLSQSSLLAHHMAIWLPVLDDDKTPTEPSAQPFAFADDYFTESQDHRQCSSQEYLISKSNRSKKYGYENQALEMDDMPSRKVVRNTSSLSRKRTNERSKKMKSADCNRASMRSLTNMHQISIPARHDPEIEMDLLNAANNLSKNCPENLTLTTPTTDAYGGAALPVNIQVTGKILLVGGESDQDFFITKRVMRIRILKMAL